MYEKNHKESDKKDRENESYTIEEDYSKEFRMLGDDTRAYRTNGRFYNNFVDNSIDEF